MSESISKPSALRFARLPSAAKWILFACSWTAAVAVCLEFGKIRSEWSGVLCGPWGCSAPLEAVLSVHAIWLLTLIPLIHFTSRKQTRIYRWWSVLLAVVGLGGTLFLAAQLGWHWPSESLGEKPNYFLQQWGLAVFGAVDVPVLPALILLPYCLWRSRLFRRKSAAS
ncbi:hypothetical protein GYB59_02530 [bacterium]|nr:hypothetical protein [bacterium]